MKIFLHSILFIWISHSLLSCKSNQVDESIAKIRYINASSLAGNINVFMDYKKVFASDIQYLNYSLFIPHIATIHTIQIKDASGNVIKDTALDMIVNKTYSGYLYDQLGSIKFKIIEEDFTTPVGSNCKIRFLHLSNDAPASDIREGSDSTILFQNYSNGAYSDYKTFGIDSLAFNASITGNSIPYYIQPTHQQFKAGNFYSLYLKGKMGSTGIDSLGFFMVENNSNY